MAIKTPPGPALGMQIVGRAVNDLMADRAIASAAGGAAQVGQPIPRYLVKLSDLTDVNFLAKAVQIGWRYLIVGTGPAAIADVKQAPSGEPSFDSLIHGDFADRLVQATDLAAQHYGTHPDQFEARILEIPSIYMSALWLHGPRDVFFSMLDGQSGKQPPLQEDTSFILRAVQAAAVKRNASQKVDKMPTPEETGLQGAISDLIKAALILNDTARQLGQARPAAPSSGAGGQPAGVPAASIPPANDSDPAAPLAGEADNLSAGRDLANYGDPIAGAAATAAPLLTLDMGKVRAFLNACMTSRPRVKYGLGKKVPSLSSVPGRDFTQVDCSGFVRQALRLGTNPVVAFPDGSVVQHDWVDAQGFAKSTPAAALQSDGLVRIAFLRPQDTSSHIGHVVLISGAKTLESHGGVGPDSRPWTATSWQASTSVYVLAHDNSVVGGAGAMSQVAAFAGGAPPQTFTVRHGHRYRATLALSGLDQFASNSYIEDMLKGYGFINASVTGFGGTRIAEATWNGPDTTAQIDSHIVSVVEIPA